MRRSEPQSGGWVGVRHVTKFNERQSTQPRLFSFLISNATRKSLPWGQFHSAHQVSCLDSPNPRSNFALESAKQRFALISKHAKPLPTYFSKPNFGRQTNDHIVDGKQNPRRTARQCRSPFFGERTDYSLAAAYALKYGHPPERLPVLISIHQLISAMCRRIRLSGGNGKKFAQAADPSWFEPVDEST